MPDWIERIFGFEPDGGDGSTEWGWAISLAITAVALPRGCASIAVASDASLRFRQSKRDTSRSCVRQASPSDNAHLHSLSLRGSVMKPSDHNPRDDAEPSSPTPSTGGSQVSPASNPMSHCDCDQIVCLLDKIARTTCLTANEVHRNGVALKSIAASLEALVEMYRTVNPARRTGLRPPSETARAAERMLSAEGARRRYLQVRPVPAEGRSEAGRRLVGQVARLRSLVQTPERHEPWTFVERPRHDEDEGRGGVPLGTFTGLIDPRQPTPRPMDFRSGPGADAARRGRARWASARSPKPSSRRTGRRT